MKQKYKIFLITIITAVLTLLGVTACSLSFDAEKIKLKTQTVEDERNSAVLLQKTKLNWIT